MVPFSIFSNRKLQKSETPELDHWEDLPWNKEGEFFSQVVGVFFLTILCELEGGLKAIKTSFSRQIVEWAWIELRTNN